MKKAQTAATVGACDKLTGEYKRIELKCREGVREELERMKELCKKRDGLYEKQNDLRGKRQEIERVLE